jgi:hypothetical protein
MLIAHRVMLLTALFALCSFAQDVRTGTVVGTVTDSSGAAVAKATVTVTNTETRVVSRGETNTEGNYYVPFLNIGSYEVAVENTGFKKYVRSGIVLQAGSTTRINVELEVGALTQEVQVTAASPLLATDSAAVGGLDDAKKVRETPMLQSKPQHLMYYMQGASALNDGSYHILGQPAALINYTIDGASVKQSVRSEIGETNTSITPPVDSIEEAQVMSTGIPAEVGHAAGGAYNMVLKSGTNQLHFATEERYISEDFIYRSYFQQSVANIATAPFEYHNFDAVLGGTVVIPKVYNGRNRTFFFLAYRLDYDHEANTSTTQTPDQNMLNGNFFFGGLGYPIYDPKTITCTNPAGCASGTGWTATPFAGNQIPQSRFDPVAVKFLSFHPYQLPNTAGFYSATGPNSNYIDLTHYLSDRQGHIAKIDQQIGDHDKLFVRYAWNKFRVVVGRNAVQYAWTAIDNTTFSYGLPEPIDERNVTLSEIHNFGPATVNEFRVAYQRRNDNISPVLNNGGWAGILGIPGVGPQTFPGFVGASGGSSVTWTANPGGYEQPLGQLPHSQRGFSARRQREPRARRPHHQMGLSGHCDPRKRCAGDAAVRNLQLHHRGKRPAQHAQYRQHVRVFSARFRNVGYVYEPPYRLPAALVVAPGLRAGRLAGYAQPHDQFRSAIQLRVSRQHEIRSQIAIRSHGDGPAYREDGGDYPSEGHGIW